MVNSAYAQTSDGLFWVAFVVYFMALIGFVAAFAYRSKGASTLAVVLASIGAAAHAGSIATRGLAAARPPWGNMYEYSSMIAFLVVVGYLVIVNGRLKLRDLGGFAIALALVSLSLGRVLYAPAGPLVPALSSWWLKVHVAAMITASSTFSIAFIFTILYLLKDRAERRAATSLFGGSTVGAAYAGPTVGDKPGFPVDYASSEPVDAKRDGEVKGFWARLPSSEKLDTLAFRTHTIGFPIWTFGVIAGAIWASKAWGRYWGWDPKETWAFITWVIYAGYLHARATAGWRGRKAALVASAGFVSLWITYYVVNLWIVGLHSYAGVK